jgi:hypothetical protein
MYRKNVEIFVSGMKFIISVPCTPDTQPVELKQMAIKIFIDNLYKENGC